MSKRTKDPVNYALLRKMRRYILARPRQFEMTGFFQRALYPLDGNWDRLIKPSHCGTACCIAGWAITLQQMPHKPMPSKANWVPYDEVTTAHKALGLTKQQAGNLFYVGSWPEPYRSAYEKAKTYTARARAGAARVAEFIKTKGAV